MTDVHLIATDTGELTGEFHKPTTVRTLHTFDRDLRLLRNKRTGGFEVHRMVKRARTFWLGDEDGYLSFYEPMLCYVCDWSVGRNDEGFDNPLLLIQGLEDRDIVRRPNLARELEEQLLEQRYAIERKVSARYGEVFKDNRRQILRAFEPFFNFPGFVR